MFLKKFWQWYERNYKLNVGVAAGLFLLQIIHLIWLFGEVVWTKLTGSSLFQFNEIHNSLMVVVDYTEIPALITTSIVYINELRKKFEWKSLLFLLFLNSQWLHLFWITDEFVVDSFLGAGSSIMLPAWLAWIAILIDYLELPVIYDTIKRFVQSLKQKNFTEALSELKEG